MYQRRKHGEKPEHWVGVFGPWVLVEINLVGWQQVLKEISMCDIFFLNIHVNQQPAVRTEGGNVCDCFESLELTQGEATHPSARACPPFGASAYFFSGRSTALSSRVSAYSTSQTFPMESSDRALFCGSGCSGQRFPCPRMPSPPGSRTTTLSGPQRRAPWGPVPEAPIWSPCGCLIRWPYCKSKARETTKPISSYCSIYSMGNSCLYSSSNIACTEWPKRNLCIFPQKYLTDDYRDDLKGGVISRKQPLKYKALVSPSVLFTQLGVSDARKRWIHSEELGNTHQKILSGKLLKVK